MKRTLNMLKKTLVIIIILMILNNFMAVPVVKANEALDAIGEAGQNFFLSFLGLLTMPIRAIVIGLAYAVNILTASIAYVEGATTTDTSTDEVLNMNMSVITPFDIFFNKARILDINFFEIGDDVSIVNTIRTGIAAWYYALRLIAMSILLVILIYVGIRMAISTIATDKAMYKKMLFDWAVSLILIFFINYIIIFIITINNTIVDAIAEGVNAAVVSDTYDTIKALALKWFDIDSIPATVIFCMLVIQTLGLVISYFNRMLKVAFLIIISPLITLTYAIDKMGDGKAQALNNWLREFVFTVFIQVFHCIIYMSMVNVAFNLLIEHSEKGIKNALLTAVMAILCVNFVKTAEGLVRKILMHGHQDNSVSVAGGMAATAVALQKSKQLGKATRKAVNSTKQNIKMAGDILKSTPRALAKTVSAPVKGVVALGSAIRSQADWSKEKNEFSDIKSKDKELYRTIRKRTKQEHKQERINNRKERIQNNRIVQKAKDIADQRSSKSEKKRKVKKSVGRVSALKRASNFKHKLDNIAAQSTSVKAVSNLVKAYTAASVGSFTGSMMYGATGNAAQAVAMGVAGYNMHKEFQKSAKTMETGTQSNLRGAGARTKEDAFKILHDVASHPEKYDGKSQESLKEAQRLLKAIEDQLKSSIGDPTEYKTKIRNELDRAALKAPEKTPEVINNLLNEIYRR